MMLVKSALSVKAALSFQSDMFVHCAHMHIHCVCMHQKAISFVELGTGVLSQGSVLDFWCSAFSTERSRQSMQRCASATCGRVAAAHICNSALTTRLIDIFANHLPVVWLACLGQTLGDLDETLETMQLILKFRRLHNCRALRATHSVTRKFCRPFNHIYSADLSTFQVRIDKTKEQALARRTWIEDLGLREIRDF